MTDEHADAGSKTASPESVEPDEDRIQVAFDEILAQKCELEERGIILYCRSLMPEQWALVAAASIYSKAFVEALAKRHADGVADLVGSVSGGRTSPTSIGSAWMAMGRRQWS